MSPRKRLAAAAPPLVLIGIALLYAGVSLDYAPRTRAIPLGVAGAAILLCLLAIGAEGQGRVGLILRRVLRGRGPTPAVPGLDGQAGMRHAPGRELAAFGWILGFLALAVAFGFYIAIPVYVTAYLRVHGGKPTLVAAATGIGLAAVLYAMFELLLGYKVFGGMLFGDIL